jgi:hypothetical protein
MARAPLHRGRGRRRAKSGLRLALWQNFVILECSPPLRSSWETTVAEQKAHNIQIHEGVSEDTFAEIRHKRDATLGMPALIIPSVQVNMRAGNFPPPEDNGVTYLKLPVNVL